MDFSLFAGEGRDVSQSLSENSEFLNIQNIVALYKQPFLFFFFLTQLNPDSANSFITQKPSSASTTGGKLRGRKQAEDVKVRNRHAQTEHMPSPPSSERHCIVVWLFFCFFLVVTNSAADYQLRLCTKLLH